MEFPYPLPFSDVDLSDDGDRWLVDQTKSALSWIEAFPWFNKLQSAELTIGFPGILIVCDIYLSSYSSNVDGRLWLISGDIPNMYLVRDDAKSAKSAIIIYCEILQFSIDCFIGGEINKISFPIKNLNSFESAQQLQTRIDFIKKHIVGLV